MGNPNAIQRALIERAVVLSLRVAQIDAKILAGRDLTLHDSNFALAWNNAYRRTLVALGLQGAAASEPPGAALDRHFRMLAERQAAHDDEDEAA